MRHLGLPRRPGQRRATATASVLLLPLALTALTACSDADDTATPPVASPAATASGARCATRPLVPSADPSSAAQPVATGAYTLDSGSVSAPRKKAFTATTADESAALVSGSGRLSTYDSKVTKSGGTSSLTASAEHGLNAALLARDGGRLNLSGGKFGTTGKGATGVAATGADARATLSASGITTQGASAHGLMASYGGALDLTYVQVITAGAQSAPIAAGPGGAKVTVSGGTMTSAGCGSPGVQTAGDVTLSNTLFDLANSEAFTVEAGGSLSLKDVRASAAAGGVMLRGAGRTSYAMSGGALQATDGDLFSVEQATADVELKGGAEVKTKSGVLLRVKEQGAASFAADGERLKGDVVVAKGSTAALDLAGSTVFDGRVKGASLTLAGSARWSVAGDSSLKGLSFDKGSDVAKEVARVIRGNGHAVTYDATSSPELGGRSFPLEGGGTLKPA
ncbi:hypothetical protein GTY65_19100 [Streptomyces sp. SID8379]|uniref:hypothetical protein n=1 Tax=unclassified Streptomyces TaxID=2593676 RepID=UPI00036741B6|nr:MULTISPECIES: hypothetical protein [unclassified Streptomyces]MYW66141.1 hypothetical protein [Streptomyces sp. SID8379]